MSADARWRDLLRDARDAFDLTRAEDQAHLTALADALQEADAPEQELRAAADEADAPLELRMAEKLVASRRHLTGEDVPATRVAVVFAMWGEQNRLQPRSADNPHGEDALRTKVAQLEWVTAGTPVGWTLYAVDDGCPFGSGALARQIADETGEERVRVLHLADHLPAESGPLRGLASAEDSRKGGSIVLGAAQALADGADVVVYTDADSSVHLGQLGLLLEPFHRDGVPVVLGDRRHPESVLVKDAARWGVGIKNLRHMQRMAGEAIFGRGILDTQAAFKLYDRGVLEHILADPVVFDFSFDTDWIGAFLAQEQPYVQVPFAFIDSASESATAKQQPMTTWEVLLKGLVAALEHRGLLRTPSAREMAEVITSEVDTHEDLEAVIDHLPPELEHAGEAEYGDPDVMSPARMREFLQERKAAAAQEG